MGINRVPRQGHRLDLRGEQYGGRILEGVFCPKSPYAAMFVIHMQILFAPYKIIPHRVNSQSDMILPGETYRWPRIGISTDRSLRRSSFSFALSSFVPSRNEILFFGPISDRDSPSPNFFCCPNQMIMRLVGILVENGVCDMAPKTITPPSRAILVDREGIATAIFGRKWIFGQSANPVDNSGAIYRHRPKPTRL